MVLLYLPNLYRWLCFFFITDVSVTVPQSISQPVHTVSAVPTSAAGPSLSQKMSGMLSTPVCRNSPPLPQPQPPTVTMRPDPYKQLKPVKLATGKIRATDVIFVHPQKLFVCL